MVTLIESPRVAFVSGSSLPASSPFSLSRLILPVLCIAIGVSVGSATGLTLALVNAPNNAVAASSDSGQASAPNAAPMAKLAANSSPAQAIKPTVITPPVADPGKTVANPAALMTIEPAKPAESRPVGPRTAGAKPAGPATAPFHAEIALNKTPDALKPATFKLGGKEWHAARMTILPDAKPAQNDPAPDAAAVPASLNTTQLSLDLPRQASVYSEGELTVAAYDATTGTVETSDGRTFVLGTTVAAGNATSWETYRSGVHYRCDQNGSCVLMRAGVVAPNARLI